MSATVPLLNQKGEKVSDIPLDEKVFDGEVNKPLLHQVIRMYQANLRQGTHATKTRGEVSGGGKKPWRQKGTGRARAGSNRSPLWRHGGTVFGPHPRDYGYTLPVKMKKLALRSALNGKVNDGEIVIVDKVNLEQAKTKEFVAFLRALKLEGKILVVVEKESTSLRRSSRNVKGISLKVGQEVNAYDMTRHRKVVIEEGALAVLLKNCLEALS